MAFVGIRWHSLAARCFLLVGRRKSSSAPSVFWTFILHSRLVPCIYAGRVARALSEPSMKGEETREKGRGAVVSFHRTPVFNGVCVFIRGTARNNKLLVQHC
jgi:hypothetical protein